MDDLNKDLKDGSNGAEAAGEEDKKHTEIDLPELKKKEKKKGGAAWAGAKPGGAPISGARAAAGQAAKAVAGAAVDAAAPGFLSNVMGSLVGKIMAAVIAALVAGVGAVAYMAMTGGSDRAASLGARDLGSIASNIQVPQEADHGLNYGASANKGKLKFDGPQKAADAKKPDAAAATSDAQQTEGENPDVQADGASPEGAPQEAGVQGVQGPGGMEHKFGKLTTEIGGAFGGKNIFQDGSGFKSANLSKFGSGTNSKGKSGRLTAKNLNLSGKLMSKKGKQFSSKSFGYLKGMNKINNRLRTGMDETRADGALSQFEATENTEGAPPESPLDAAPPPNQPGGPNGGVPCTGIMENGVCVPITVAGVNVNPWEAKYQEAKSKIKEATGWLWAAAAAFTFMLILIAIAIFWTATGCCSCFAVPFWAWAAVIMAVIGAILAYQVYRLSKDLHRIGNEIKAAVDKKGGAAGANLVGSAVYDIGTDLRDGAWWAITGIGGMVVANSVAKRTDELQDKAHPYLNEQIN